MTGDMYKKKNKQRKQSKAKTKQNKTCTQSRTTIMIRLSTDLKDAQNFFHTRYEVCIRENKEDILLRRESDD